MNSEPKFRRRPRPPKAAGPLYRQEAEKFRQHLRKTLPKRPWHKKLRVAIDENKRTGLVLWIILPSAIDAFWAASLIRHVDETMTRLNGDIRRISVTAPTHPKSGYAPLISSQVSEREFPHRIFSESEYQGFIRYLNWCASDACPAINQTGGMRLLMHLANSSSLQWETVNAFVKFAARQKFLTCSVDDALGALTSQERASHPLWACPNGITRWQAIKTLVEEGYLVDFVGRQRPLRPFHSTATLVEIRALVANAFQLTSDDILGASRQAHIMHARQIAAAVMRRVTSRTLVEIGGSLGGRDHSTVMNSLERIEKWKQLDPMHAGIVESFAQIADNMGILKVSALRKLAIQQMKRHPQDLHSNPNDPSIGLVANHSGSPIQRSDITQLSLTNSGHPKRV